MRTSRRTLPTWALVPVLAGVAVAVTVAVQLAARAVALPVASNVPTAAVTWSVVCGSLLLVLAVLPGRAPFWLRAVVVVASLTAIATAVLAWPLHGTSYYLGGLESDQQFRTQYLTRLASDPALADQNYAGLPPFYPAGWFWPAGRLADLLGLAPWAAYKPIALATVGLTPALSWGVWTPLVGWRRAVGIALATLLAGLSAAVAEPYSWPVAALIPAAVAVFWRCLKAGRARVSRLLAVGVFLGAAGSTYTLYGFFTAAVLVLAAVVVVARAGDRRSTVRRAAGALGTVAGTALLVALPAWAPFLLRAARSGVGENVAARFLPAGSAGLPDVLGADPWSLLLTTGLVALLLRCCTRWGRHPDVLAALAITVGAAYAWYAASTLALLAGTTLLAFRFEPVVAVALAGAGVLALTELGERGLALAAGRGRSPGRLRLAAGVLAVLAVAQVVPGRTAPLDDRVAAAYRTPYPGGPDPRGTADPGREEAWSDALAGEIARQTGADPRDLVVLTTDYSLLSFQPYRGFQQITPHYANPLADYSERADCLAQLATSRDAGELVRRLDASPWAPPRVFVLQRADDGLHLKLGRDAFPASPNIAFSDLVFRPDVFSAPAFTTGTVGPYLVATRRS